MTLPSDLSFIDTSHFNLYDPQFERQALAIPNVVKLTQDVTYVDPTGVDRFLKLRATGQPRGVYHFLGNSDPAQQAHFFAGVFKQHFGALQPPLEIVMADVEPYYRGSGSNLVVVVGEKPAAFVTAFLQACSAEFAIDTEHVWAYYGIYYGAGYSPAPYRLCQTTVRAGWPWVVPYYTRDQSYPAGKIPPGLPPVAHQPGQTTVPGWLAPVDWDRHIDQTRLQAIFGGTHDPTPQPPDPAPTPPPLQPVSTPVPGSVSGFPVVRPGMGAQGHPDNNVLVVQFMANLWGAKLTVDGWYSSPTGPTGQWIQMFQWGHNIWQDPPGQVADATWAVLHRATFTPK